MNNETPVRTFGDLIKECAEQAQSILSVLRTRKCLFLDFNSACPGEVSSTTSVDLLRVVINVDLEDQETREWADSIPMANTPLANNCLSLTTITRGRLLLSLPYYTLCCKPNLAALFECLEINEQTTREEIAVRRSGNMCCYGRIWLDWLLNLNDLPMESRLPVPDCLPAFDNVIFLLRTYSITNSPRVEGHIPELRACYSTIYTRLASELSASVPALIRFSVDTPLWEARERMRFYNSSASGYEPLPQEIREVLDPEAADRIFPHMAVMSDFTGMIAFTPNSQAGSADRQTVMKPGRFIRRFARSDVDDNVVKALAAWACSAVKLTFFESNAADDYAKVYQTGPNSCMSYGDLSSRGPFDNQDRKLMVGGEFFHPTRVYAHPENALKICWGAVNGGSPAVRVLVNTRTKTHSTIYCAESPASALIQMQAYLNSKGYTDSDECVFGEPLLHVCSDNGDEICPFLDPHNVGVEKHGDRLVAPGPWKVLHTTGTMFFDEDADESEEDEGWYCASCDEYQHVDSESYTTSDDTSICTHCSGHRYTEAYSPSRRETVFVHQEDTIYDLQYVTTGALRHHDYLFLTRNECLGNFDLIELSDEHYDDSYASVAESYKTIELETGGYVLTADLEDLDLFTTKEERTAYEKDNYGVIANEDGDIEVIELCDVDDDEFVESPAEHHNFPGVKFFIHRAEEVAEEVAEDTQESA